MTGRHLSSFPSFSLHLCPLSFIFILLSLSQLFPSFCNICPAYSHIPTKPACFFSKVHCVPFIPMQVAPPDFLLKKSSFLYEKGIFQRKLAWEYTAIWKPKKSATFPVKVKWKGNYKPNNKNRKYEDNNT